HCVPPFSCRAVLRALRGSYLTPTSGSNGLNWGGKHGPRSDTPRLFALAIHNLLNLDAFHSPQCRVNRGERIRVSRKVHFLCKRNPIFDFSRRHCYLGFSEDGKYNLLESLLGAHFFKPGKVVIPHFFVLARVSQSANGGTIGSDCYLCLLSLLQRSIKLQKQPIDGLIERMVLCHVSIYSQ